MVMTKICSQPILLVLAAMCLFLEFGMGQAQSPQHRSEAEHEALLSLSSTLESLNCQAVIEYSGRCYRPRAIIAPAIVLNASPIRREDVAGTLQQVLSKDKRFTITSNQDGIFTIAQADIPQDLLNVRIREIVFTEQQQYEPRDAMHAVLSAPEVQEYMQAHRISAANDWGGLVAGPGTGGPHLNPKIEDITVLYAIKTILKTFPFYAHLAVYRECSESDGRRIIAVTFK
jgi:hypothetical protein